MATRRFILARHGETELNRLGIVQGSGIDPALNEFGRAQAEALFGAFGREVDLVVSSGMVRARETAAPFVAAGIAYAEDARFREICWGEHEGKVADPAMRAEYATLMADWEAGRYDAAHRGGESARELADRLWAGWLDLRARDCATGLLVTHGRALRCLVCLLEDRPLAEMNGYEHANAGYYVVEGAGERWAVTTRNRVDHLRALGSATPAP